MSVYILNPGIGIGDIKFGMSCEDVHRLLGTNGKKYVDGNKIIEEYHEGCFQIHYDTFNKLEFIEILRFILPAEVLFKRVNVFETKADVLLPFIEKYEKHDGREWESEQGYKYVFTKTGLCLWRPNVFKEETLNKEWFQKLSQEEKEHELRSMYFETVILAVEGFWESFFKKAKMEFPELYP